MSDVTIWHNPRCSKSRETLQLLRDRGIEPTIVEYLKTPPTEAELTHALAELGTSPRGLMRTKEALYRELGLDSEERTDAELVAAMASHPILIERPVVFIDGVRRGGVEVLQNFQATQVVEIRRRSGTDATTLYGTGVGGGTIEVRTRR